jgi:chromate transport protein ChrA
MKNIVKIIQSKYTAIFWTILIFILCTLPSKHLPQNNDKISHFIAFAGFTFFWFFQTSKYWLIILTATIYGIGIEFWQGNLPESFHRNFDWYDALADAVGGMIGLPVHIFFDRLTKILIR